MTVNGKRYRGDIVLHALDAGLLVTNRLQLMPGDGECWKLRCPELVHGVSDGDTTLKTMKYVWLANFCGAPSITVPAGYVEPEGKADEGEVVSDLDTEGKVPVGLMATGEWASEHALLQFGLDAEAVGRDKVCRPPNWVDVLKLAKEGKESEA
jgi:Asp-tRNA(Asn)/Glu-tRNA(Gln) amidotransferase A subunit family amidase